MGPVNDRPDVQAALDRLGLNVPATDLPFLQRTLSRQQEVLAQLRGTVPPETEPAHVFRLLAKTDVCQYGDETFSSTSTPAPALTGD
jgi:hypothetical protein